MFEKFILIRLIKLIKRAIKLIRIQIAVLNAEQSVPTKDIEQRIRSVAEAHSVDPELAIKVARCESKLDSLAMNMNFGGTVDRGLFQWNDHYHPEVDNNCAFSIECSTIRFCRAVKDGKLSWWFASQKCWQD